MDERTAAEEHLRVIRSLMERATVYRAISAPTAIVGALLSFAASAVLVINNGATKSGESVFSLTNPNAGRQFIIIWCVVLVATLLANTFFIWRKANREQSPLVTSGLRLAIYSASPVLIVTAALTWMFWRNNETVEALPIVAVVWITCYGLALLTTSSFAPLSLQLTGWAFLLTGLACTFLLGGLRLFNSDPPRTATVAMAVTFGLYNLVYGLATWPRKRDGA